MAVWPGGLRILKIWARKTEYDPGGFWRPLLPPGSSPSSPVGRAKEMTSLMVDLFIKTYNLMGYDAFTPGEIDLSWGIDELQKISKRARFAFLLSNLLDKKTKEPVFTPFLIKETGGGKIGLFGLVSDRFSLPGPPGEKESFQIAEPDRDGKKNHR